MWVLRKAVVQGSKKRMGTIKGGNPRRKKDAFVLWVRASLFILACAPLSMFLQFPCVGLRVRRED